MGIEGSARGTEGHNFPAEARNGRQGALGNWAGRALSSLATRPAGPVWSHVGKGMDCPPLTWGDQWGSPQLSGPLPTCTVGGPGLRTQFQGRQSGVCEICKLTGLLQMLLKQRGKKAGEGELLFTCLHQPRMPWGNYAKLVGCSCLWEGDILHLTLRSFEFSKKINSLTYFQKCDEGANPTSR